MTPQEITKNNILLAEFMGYKKQFHHYHKGTEIKTVESFKFHNDWNSLMEIVQAIESKGGLFKSFRWTEEDVLLEEGYWCTITDHFSEKVIADSAEIKDTDTKIEAMYVACIQFVKWYNQNKGGN